MGGIIITSPCTCDIKYNKVPDLTHQFITVMIRQHNFIPNVLVIRIDFPFFITIIYYFIYIRGIWRSLIYILIGVTLRNNLFFIINEGVISTQNSTKVLTSKYIFQGSMIIMDRLLNIRISWFSRSKVLNYGLIKKIPLSIRIQ